jgi:hypothetical protein
MLRRVGDNRNSERNADKQQAEKRGRSSDDRLKKGLPRERVERPAHLDIITRVIAADKARVACVYVCSGCIAA